MKSKNESNNKLMMLLMMVASGSIEVTEDQVAGITHILMAGMDESTGVLANASVPEGNDLVWGIAGLARLMNCSTVSAQRMRNEGLFDEAMYKFGKKLAWDKKKVLEISENAPYAIFLLSIVLTVLNNFFFF